MYKEFYEPVPSRRRRSGSVIKRFHAIPFLERSSSMKWRRTNKCKCIVVLLIFLLSTLSYSQSDIAIGQWKAHLPYQFGRYVTQSESTVYFATDWSVLTLDKGERAVDFISTVDGLSQAGIGIIKYHPPTETLITTYSNGVIDLVQPTGVVTLTDIQNFTNVVIDKNILDIFIADDGRAYLATGYGVSALNLEEEVFEFTSFSGVGINAIVVKAGQLYAATGEGIYRTDLDNPFIQDFNSWTLLDQTAGFPFDYSTKAMTIWNEDIYLDVNDSLYVFNNGQANYFHHIEDKAIKYITAEGPNLILGTRCLPNCEGEMLRFKTDGTIDKAGGTCTDRPLYAIEDAQERVWFADDFRGIRVADNLANDCSKTIFNSPYSHHVSELAVFEGNLYVAAGGLKDNGQNQFRRDGFFSLVDGEWTRYSEGTVSFLKQQGILFDYYRVAARPSDGHLFIGTFTKGLLEFDGESFIIYDDKNSTIQQAPRDTSNRRIGGIAFDDENNLWLSNHSALRPISVFKSDGTWKSFSVPGEKNLLQAAVDEIGYKWFVVNDVGVLVFDDGGTIDDTSDDRYRYFRQNNSALPSAIINCVEVDRDGKVWVGTGNGVVVFECDPFNEECIGSLPIVGENEIDDEDEYLLRGEDVKAIAVNGANQKWLGTTNGIFLQSENGRNQIAFYNEKNSPLFDNRIIDIAIDHESGEVYIATNKGVISYRGEATAGGRFNDLNAYAFPNPVRPGYNGPIAIKGLAENANVKITDITGQLIFETTAQGGQAIWDGRDYNGRRASTGVYLVFSTKVDLNNPDTLVTKILFVN